MKSEIFGFSDYKDYLRERAGAKNTKKGVKAALARAMNCQATYLSQVLHGNAHLSLEQAERANSFFGHSRDEAALFLLLVQKARAGTATLAEFFQEQIDVILERRLNLTARLGKIHTLSEHHQSIYYSSWIYSAVHIALTIPGMRDRASITGHLGIPPRLASVALDFLLACGLAVQEGDSYRVTTERIRLGNDSHNIIKHHANWRMKAIETLDDELRTDLHYSGVVSISAGDVVKIKDQLLESIQKLQEVVRDSPEEELCAVSLDFFKLNRHA